MAGSQPPPVLATAETTTVGMSHAHRGRARRAGTVIQQDAAFKHLRSNRAKVAQGKRPYKLRKKDGTDSQDDSDDGIDTDTQPDAVMDDSDSSASGPNLRPRNRGKGSLKTKIKKVKQNKRNRPKGEPTRPQSDEQLFHDKTTTQSNSVRFRMKQPRSRMNSGRSKSGKTKTAAEYYNEVVIEATKHYDRESHKNYAQGAMLEILKWRTRQTAQTQQFEEDEDWEGQAFQPKHATIKECMKNPIPITVAQEYVDSPQYQSKSFGPNCQRLTPEMVKDWIRAIYVAERALGWSRDVPGEDTPFFKSLR